MMKFYTPSQQNQEKDQSDSWFQTVKNLLAVWETQV